MRAKNRPYGTGPPQPQSSPRQRHAEAAARRAHPRQQGRRPLGGLAPRPWPTWPGVALAPCGPCLAVFRGLLVAAVGPGQRLASGPRKLVDPCGVLLLGLHVAMVLRVHLPPLLLPLLRAMLLLSKLLPAPLMVLVLLLLLLLVEVVLWLLLLVLLLCLLVMLCTVQHAILQLQVERLRGLLRIPTLLCLLADLLAPFTHRQPRRRAGSHSPLPPSAAAALAAALAAILQALQGVASRRRRR